MTRRLILVTMVALLAVATTRAAVPQGTQGTAGSGFNSNNAWEHLQTMVAMGPRPAGSPALVRTRAYITKQLASYGLHVKEQAFQAMTPVGKIDMVNLIVTLPGRRADRILLTGHYDTKIEKGFKFVGASDAASSAAELTELARVLKDKPHDFTYEFVWFDGEEAVCNGWDECGKPGSPDNTYGSRYYVEAAKKSNTLSSIKAMILLDMMGAKDLKLRRETEYSAPWLMDLVWGTAKQMGHSDVFLNSDGPVGGDDHLPFVQAGIPSLDIIDLVDYPQWHQPADDLDHVSARSLGIVGDVLVAALPGIEKHLAAH